MKYAIIENGVVVNLAVSSGPLDSNWVQFTSEVVRVGDSWDGQTFTPAPIPVPDAATIQAAIVEATQARLDAFARTRNYDGILSACTYASSVIPKFSAEGQYCVNARDSTWLTLYGIMEAVQTAQRPLPAGFADIESELPALAWPI